MYFDKSYYKDDNTVQQQELFWDQKLSQISRICLFLLKSFNFETKNSLICESLSFRKAEYFLFCERDASYCTLCTRFLNFKI